MEVLKQLRKRKERITPLKILQVLCLCLFGARAWQHLRWESSLESSWGWPHFLIEAIGLFLVIMALVTSYSKRFPNQKLLKVLLLLGSFSLLLLTLSAWQAKSFQLAQLIEHSIQWTLPLIFVYAFFHNMEEQKFIFSIKIVIALTFIGHGMYAAGIYPVPGNFIAMTVSILGLEPEGAKSFLFLAGVLDIVVAIGLFIPALQRSALIYAIIWGSLTALARVVAYFDISDPMGSLDRWLFETLYRLGHGGVPLVLYLILISRIKNSKIQ